jgi:MFS family permease
MGFGNRGSQHHWRFHRLGGFDQVRIETGEDIRQLAGLDQKLWAALSCPATNVEFDGHTLALLDSDGDGRIRVPEVLAAVEWVCRVLRDPGDLLKGEAVLPLAAINPETNEGKQVLSSARRILEYLGKPDAAVVTAEDTADTNRIFASTRFNGDGIVTPAAADNPALAQLIRDIMACIGSAPDRSGEAGIAATHSEQFFEAARAYADWWTEAEADAAKILPLGEKTAAAMQSFTAVRAKIDDYFTRTRLAAYDARAVAPLNPAESDYTAISPQTLSASTEAVAAFPIARIEAERALPLDVAVNPAWADALARFHELVVAPLHGRLQALNETAWQDIRQRFADHAAWLERKRGAAVDPLGINRIRQLLGDDSETRVAELIAQDTALEGEANAIHAVDRLVHYYRNLHVLLSNFVSLRDFYTPGRKAIFQVGTLYLDGRSCELCVQVADVATHSALAALSRTYLAYCDCRRRGGDERMTIAAAFTGGDSDNLMTGRNGVFYDRQGRDWDATIVKIIEHPISVSQAFWAPYKRVLRMISEQIEKFAGAREKAVESGAAEGIAEVSAKAQTGKASPPPFDIAKFAGIFAAIGLAIGAIGTALAAVVTGFLGLRWWQMPLAVGGLILIISGPSMLLAWLKLRQRNLGPLLDANGWAVNILARINIPFGATLTATAALPSGAERSLRDPFAEKKRPWGLYLFLAGALIALAIMWQRGLLPAWWKTLDWHWPRIEQPAEPAQGEKAKPAPAP